MSLDVPSLFDTGKAPGLAPRAKLAKGGGGGAGGFGGDLLSAAAGALGVAQADPLTDALSSATVQRLAAPAISTCQLRFLPRSDFPALALGDTLTVKLAAGGAPQVVFTGDVAQVIGNRGAIDVLLAAPSAKLSRVRRNAGYENQGFADLLNTWAGEAGLDTGRIDSGPQYAFFAVDDRLSLWDWVARLARHADLPAWTDADGALNASKPAGPPAASFKFGETVLALDTHARDPVTTGARIVGEGSAGRQGSDAWAWLAKDPQGVSAGGGPVESEGGLRDLSSVAAAATGAAAGAARIADVVRVTVPGEPALDVASLFELENCPNGEGDGRWQVIELRHRFSARGGFLTEIVGVAA